MLEGSLNSDNKQVETEAIQGEVIDTRIAPKARRPLVTPPDYLQGLKRIPTKGTKVDVKA